MRNPFLWADEVLVTRITEPRAWYVQYRWGWDNFDLAHWANHISHSGLFLAGAMALTSDRQYHFAPLAAFIAFRWWQDSREMINSVAALVRKSPTALNPRRTASLFRILLFWAIFPAMALGLMAADGRALCTLSAWVFVAFEFIGAYLLACNPMPPKWKPKQALFLRSQHTH